MISLIIPTYNRINWLQKCLSALYNELNGNEHEIIIIDDGSTDDTEKILNKDWIQQKINQVFFKQTRGGPAKARNFGVHMAKGDIVCFLDDDSIVQKGWLNELIKTFNTIDGSYAAVKGKVNAYQDTYLPEFLEKYIHVSDSWATNNIAFRKEVFLKANGFDEGFTIAAWEDLDLGFRLEKMGYKRYYNEKIIVHHPHEETIVQLKKKFKINGYGFYQFCKKWIKIDPKWIILMWIERFLVFYYMMPGMEKINYLKYIHGLRIRYELYGMLKGVINQRHFEKLTKDD